MPYLSVIADAAQAYDGLDRILGLRRIDPVPSLERIMAMVHPDDRDRIADARRLLFEEPSNERHEVKYRLVLNDGSVYNDEA